MFGGIFVRKFSQLNGKSLTAFGASDFKISLIQAKLLDFERGRLGMSIATPMN